MIPESHFARGPNSDISEGAEFAIDFPNSGDCIEAALYCPIMVGLDDNVQIITPRSPIGRAIKGLKEGKSFTYKVGDETIDGIVKNIR